MRQKNRPPLGTGRPSFRDDTSLVGFRYEKTKPAEPPVPLPPPRNPLRSSSSVSISRSNTTATNVSRSTSNSSVTSFSVSPVVVAPPTSAYMPLVAPPTEQHPALRSPLPANALGIQEGKRDSGHAATTASGSVIHEEDCEDDFDHEHADRRCSEKMKELARDGTVPEAVEHLEYRVDEGRALAVVDQDRRATAAAAAASAPVTVAAVQERPASTKANSPSPQHSPHADTNSRVFKQPVSPRKLVKKNSTRFSSFRTKSNEASEKAREPAPMESEPAPLMRGSIAAPTSSSAHKPAQHEDVSLQTALPPFGLSGGPNRTSSAAIFDLDAQFAPLAISIPTDGLLDDEFMTGFSFSKRGSLMFGGKRATMAFEGATDLPPPSSSTTVSAHDHIDAEMPPPASVYQTRQGEASTERPSSSLSAADTTVARAPMAQPVPDIRILSPDIEKESQKVRSLYATGDAINWEDGARFSFCEHLEPTPEVPAEEDAHDPYAVLWLTPKSFLTQFLDFANIFIFFIA